MPAAALDLAFSFESGLQGFGPNGLGVTVTQDTIGATEGTQSMKVSLVEGATFEGALTTELLPFIGDPPGLDFIVFDLTITEQFPEEANFVDAGITVFASTQPDFPGGPFEGLSIQFQADQVQLGDLPVGTHEVRMNLLNAVNPLTFTSQSFNEIVGELGSDPNDLIPTSFQIYINKSADAPWTGYFDNIRTGSIGGPNGGDYNGDGVVNAADYTVWRDSFPLGLGGDGTTTGDLLGVPDGTIDESDYDYWAQEYGNVIASASGVPEPSTVFLTLVAGVVGMLATRTR